MFAHMARVRVEMPAQGDKRETRPLCSACVLSCHRTVRMHDVATRRTVCVRGREGSCGVQCGCVGEDDGLSDMDMGLHKSGVSFAEGTLGL